MGFRVTQTMLQRTLLADVQRLQRRMVVTQEQAASGLRVNRPSDDPAAASQATSLRAQLESSAQLSSNGVTAQGRLLAADRAVQEIVDVLARARELAIQGANDTLDATSRRLLSVEVESLHEQLLSVGNQAQGGAHLFAGYATDGPAFTSSGPFASGSPPPSVSYAGDGNEIRLEVDEGVHVETTLDGRRLFLGDADGDGATDAGREDLFDTLAALWQALQNDDRAAVGNTLDRLDAAQEQAETERARAGARLGRVDAAAEALARREVELQTRLSEVQDADTLRVFSDLVQQETVLAASLDATARIIRPTLLDFLG